MNILTKHNQFLSDNFPGLNIKKPLFYNWELSLRFDLQKKNLSPNSPWKKEYFNEVYHRAETLFNFCFQNSKENVLLIVQQIEWEDSIIEEDDYILKQISNFDNSLMGKERIENLYEAEDMFDNWNRAMYQTTLDKINFKNLIHGICNTDFPDRKPHIDNELYLINLNEKIIFHIYDDRGLDVLMTDKNKLKILYDKHPSWILEHDREAIIKRLF